MMSRWRRALAPALDLDEVTSQAHIRRTLSGWAVVQESRVQLANSPFLRLASSSAGRDPWRLQSGSSDGSGGRAYGSLRELVLGEAAAVARSRAAARLRVGRGDRTFEVLLEPMTRRPGVTPVLVVVNDVSRLARAETEARVAEAALFRYQRERGIGELAMGIAHDLKNMLGALDLRLSILVADVACRAAQGENITTLRRIVADMGRMISKIQGGGRLHQAPAPLDLRDLVASAIDVAGSGLRLVARQRGVDLRIDTAIGDLPPVLGLGDDLHHVIINLLINARDAMADGGTIRLSAETRRNEVVLRMEDEGPGIAPEHLPHIFEPFFTTKGENGTGLGLTLAQSVVERCGGTIAATNRPGGGACIEVRLRRADAPSAATAPEMPRRPPLRAPRTRPNGRPSLARGVRDDR